MAKETVTSIEKSYMILDQLALPPYEYKVAELSALLRLNRSSVYRILQILKNRELVIFSPDTEKYKIGPAMYHIGMKYLYNNNFSSRIVDILSEISDKTKESVGMAVKDGNKIMSIFEIEVHQPMKLNDVPGRYFPVNKGNYGKCIMAFQSDEYIEEFLADKEFEKTCPNTLTTKEELIAEYKKIRERGYSLSIDELGVDILGAGIPIFGEDSKIKACVAIGFYRSDGWEEKLQRFVDILLSYQAQIEHAIP